MGNRAFLRVWPAALVVWAVGCSGSGVSTTARDDSAESLTGMEMTTGPSSGDDEADSGDDEADDGDATSSASGDESSGDDEDAAEAGEEAGDTSPGAVELEGDWLSTGDDLSPLLVQLTGAQRIDATFAADTFTVLTLDSEGQEVEQTGVYADEASGFGGIFTITLEQSMPTAITVEGIYEIDDTVDPPIMRYEVVQTMPSVGAVPPTAEGGFGSTAYGSDLTQIFVRQ